MTRDVSGRHARRSTCERGAWLAALFTLALGCKGSEAPPSIAPDVTASSAPITPRLAEVRVTDLTPNTLRLTAVSDGLPKLIEDAFYASFTRAEEDPTACRAHITIGYAQVVNGKPVPSAEDGTARAIFGGEVFCPDANGRPSDGFRLQLDAERAFGGELGTSGPEQLQSVTRDLVREGADALFGQVQIRAADDDAIRAALRQSEHPGVLAEAASEAGERRLLDTGEALIRLTAHTNRRVATRAGAAIGLLKLDTPGAIKALVALTEGPDTEKHLVAIHALGDLGSADAKRYLEVLAMGHPNPTIRELARERLGRPGAEAEPIPEPVPDPLP